LHGNAAELNRALARTIREKDVAKGLLQAGHYQRRRRREFLDFMNEVVARHPGKELHIVLDNLRTHKPKLGFRWNYEVSSSQHNRL
jgi:hypothetical protein